MYHYEDNRANHSINGLTHAHPLSKENLLRVRRRGPNRVVATQVALRVYSGRNTCCSFFANLDPCP